uniref:Uncharacterized protein n=1 Tax=Arundo donax TaxID=35708 RepID=A0A0A8ZIZ1_ARUDO
MNNLLWTSHLACRSVLHHSYRCILHKNPTTHPTSYKHDASTILVLANRKADSTAGARRTR